MASAADVRIASPDASFGAGEIRWGWHGGSGQTATADPPDRAGSRFEAAADRRPDGVPEEALQVGLVQQLVPREELFATALELATTISERSPIATQRVKYMVRVAQNVPLEAGLLIENDSFSYLMMTEDAAEGRTAFAEKRTPVFKGR